MSERERRSYEVEDVDRQRVDKLARLIEGMLTDKHISDPVEDGLLRALLPELDLDGRMRPHMAEVFAIKRARNIYFPDGYGLRAMEFAVDKQLRHIIPNGYYPRLTHTEAAFHYFDVFDESNFDYYDFNDDMQEDLRSTIPMGYQIFGYLSLAFKDRVGPKPILADTGTGFLIALKQLMMNDRFPYRPYRVLSAPGRGEPITPELPPDPVGQELVDYLALQKHNIHRAVGYDLAPLAVGSPAVKELVFSHTFPFSESLRNPRAVQEFNDLAAESPDNVQLIPRNIDATNPESLAQLAQFLPDGNKADIFTMSASYFEMAPDKLRTFFTNFLPYCNPGALFFVNEFARVDTRAANGLKVTRGTWWSRLGQFATFVVDPFEPDKPPVEVARFMSRRCEELWLTKAGKELLAKAALDT